VKKIKPVGIAVIELRLTEGISQSVSHKKIPLNKFFLKFRGNFLKAFRVDLKAYLGLVSPITNTAPPLYGKIDAGFRVILLHGYTYFLVITTMNQYCGSRHICNIKELQGLYQLHTAYKMWSDPKYLLNTLWKHKCLWVLNCLDCMKENPATITTSIQETIY